MEFIFVKLEGTPDCNWNSIKIADFNEIPIKIKEIQGFGLSPSLGRLRFSSFCLIKSSRISFGPPRISRNQRGLARPRLDSPIPELWHSWQSVRGPKCGALFEFVGISGMSGNPNMFHPPLPIFTFGRQQKTLTKKSNFSLFSRIF